MEALLERIQGSFQTSCEAELQELMKQIDIMVAHKKAEWETQTRALESCLDVREQELSSLRNALDEKCKEIERLCQRLEGMEQLNRDMTMEYEQQLRKVQEELARLKRSYEKLLKKQLKEARKLPSRSQEEDQSEVSILTKKLEEFRQKALDWEKQRLHYQQHVASLEAQRKAFSEQSDLIQAQLSSRKQMFESVELASQSEIHHLTSKLERANDTICANELEVERLNMKVDDLTSSNQKILEEHQRVLDELKVSRNSLEVLHEEKMELRATLLSQEDFINNLQMHKEQLQKEVSKLTETLQNKEAFVRSLEECLQSSEGTNRIYRSRTELDNIHLQLDHPEMIHLEGSLGSANANHAPPSELLTEKCQELQLTEEHLCQAKAEIKKLKEQLLHKEHSHNSELEGMKQEVAQLTRELHQRDITIASSNSCTLNLEQQLKMEIEKAERKAVEHRAVLSQLESLKQDNHQLSEILQKGKSAPLAEFQESYTKALNKVESENQRLLKELAETKASLEASSRRSQGRYENIMQQMQQQMTEIKNVESRRLQELQCKHEEEMRVLQDKFDKTVQHYEEEIQKVQHLSTRRVFSTADGLSPQISRSNSVESLSCDPLLRSDSLPHGNSEFTYMFGKNEKELLSLSPLPTTNIGAIAVKFLEEEEERSQHILERLDAHIEELKKESEMTIQQFKHQK
uniref:centrosomal protein of 63 kDa isoform X2 n=1 Tax=Podarcis muralis TaxID=64176 RepID=UPI00109F98F4|nr:centrosomal protein of 63 kDa isoform X2 [Podarcis muralis]XP_028586734.1 centrosomal protein of 63 kDa isoform X2 [Podarcis muralis]XP_028586735.1 centrosomal protein of 63 kDa isoform X2 [Podarcis muralis]